MILSPSRLFTRLVAAFPDHRTFIMQGGTSSTKTYSTLQFIYLLANRLQKPAVFSIVSESVPHLRRGALRDWMNILGETYDPEAHHKTDETFKIGQCTIEFFAVDHPDKARGGRRDYLFINECNRVPLATADQLKVRTSGKVFLDFNPTSRFWAHDMINQEGVWFDKSNYQDAIDGKGQWLISKAIREDIESHKGNENWWRVYGLGEIGQLEGMIISDYELCERMPPGIETVCGLDFGYTNDPSVLVEVGIQDGKLWVNELFYARGMTNPAITAKMKELCVPYDYLIYADSAEPKSIAEIGEKFNMIRPCIKGEGSFNLGIDFVKRYKLMITSKSLNVIKDVRNATWMQDINGNYTNKPCKGFLHSLDAIRYALTDLINPPRSVVGM